ncbi:MAG: alanine racemase [Gammaproteobacteria bacterium]|nr:alanine racemase [Gammaproteobacteria bacterium]
MMGPHANIELDALRHNLQRVREISPGSAVMAVIKANAYGHGALRAAGALVAADAFAVARVEEGVVLREAGFQKDILVLEGSFGGAELQAASRHHLMLAVVRPQQLEVLDRKVLPQPVNCWLKLDTGMHRLGFQLPQAREAYQRLQACPNVGGPVRLMTHLANADNLQDDTTSKQLAAFLPLAESWGVQASMANSAGILGWPQSHGEWVRPGIMLYGASPFMGGRGENDGLKPVMTFCSRLLAVNRYAKGEAVGYGGSWRCPEDMPLGVVAVGYGDGYPRHAPSGTPVLLNGQRVPLAGRVSMDMISVDLRTQPDARVGDPVVLWGEGLPAEEIADCAGTISYELFCGVTPRVRFRVSN